MKFKRHLKFEYGINRIDTLPMVNVILLLLLFSMIISGFVMQAGIGVDLPRAITGTVGRLESISLTILGDNIVYYEGRAMTIPQLRSLFDRCAQKGESVLIKADKRVSLERITQVWDLCRVAGISQINIATNQ
jgi:biopolymer transport protein ExbD